MLSAGLGHTSMGTCHHLPVLSHQESLLKLQLPGVGGNRNSARNALQAAVTGMNPSYNLMLAKDKLQ